MGLQYSICRIPSVPQGWSRMCIRPFPHPVLYSRTLGWEPGSQLPLETYSFIMHDLTLWIPNAIDDQTICSRWFEFFIFFFWHFSPGLYGRLKTGWSSMVALQKKKKKSRFTSWNSGHYLCIWEFFPMSMPHPVIIPYSGGIGEQVGKAIYFKLQIRWISEPKDKMIFLRKDGFYCYTLRNRSRFRMRHLKNCYWSFFSLDHIMEVLFLMIKLLAVCVCFNLKN